MLLVKVDHDDIRGVTDMATLLNILNREPGREIVLNILRNYDRNLANRGETVSYNYSKSLQASKKIFLGIIVAKSEIYSWIL